MPHIFGSNKFWSCLRCGGTLATIPIGPCAGVFNKKQAPDWLEASPTLREVTKFPPVLVSIIIDYLQFAYPAQSWEQYRMFCLRHMQVEYKKCDYKYLLGYGTDGSNHQGTFQCEHSLSQYQKLVELNKRHKLEDPFDQLDPEYLHSLMEHWTRMDPTHTGFISRDQVFDISHALYWQGHADWYIDDAEAEVILAEFPHDRVSLLDFCIYAEKDEEICDTIIERDGEQVKQYMVPKRISSHIEQVLDQYSAAKDENNEGSPSDPASDKKEAKENKRKNELQEDNRVRLRAVYRPPPDDLEFYITACKDHLTLQIHSAFIRFDFNPDLCLPPSSTDQRGTPLHAARTCTDDEETDEDLQWDDDICTDELWNEFCRMGIHQQLVDNILKAWFTLDQTRSCTLPQGVILELVSDLRANWRDMVEEKTTPKENKSNTENAILSILKLGDVLVQRRIHRQNCIIHYGYIQDKCLKNFSDRLEGRTRRVKTKNIHVNQDQNGDSDLSPTSSSSDSSSFDPTLSSHQSALWCNGSDRYQQFGDYISLRNFCVNSFACIDSFTR